MPWAASPPSAFCQEKVTTSSLSQGSACAKAAEVASQIVRPARSAGMLGLGRHPNARGRAVPGEDDVVVEVDLFEVDDVAVGGLERAGLGSFSCLTASVTQPSPKLSQASTSTGRAPSSVHMAISTAPVSEPGTMPMR